MEEKTILGAVRHALTMPAADYKAEQPWLTASQDWLLHILDAENSFVL